MRMTDEHKNKTQLIKEIDELRCQITILKNHEAERQQATQRVEHLNLILRATRRVDQLISKEKDCVSFIKGVCKSMTTDCGCYNSWVAVLDESKNLVATAESGLGDLFFPMLERLEKGEFTDCALMALSRSKPVLIKDPLSSCLDCPLASVYNERCAVTCRLEYDGNVYGLLSVSIPREFILDGEIEQLFGDVADDISFALHSFRLKEERNWAEGALRKNEEKLENILHGSPIPTFVIDRNHIVTYWNSALEKVTGLNAKDVVGNSKQWRAFYSQERPCLVDLMVDGKIGDIHEYYHGKYRTSDLIPGAYETIGYYPKMGSGTGKWLLVTAAPLKDSEGKLIGAIETLQDITETKKAEQQVKLLSKQIIEIQERERESISREIHDNVGQLLGALKMGLSRANRKIPQDLSVVKEQLSELLNLANKTISEIRELSHVLHPPLIDDLGVISALEELCQGFKRYSNIRINWSFEPIKETLKPIVNITIYRLFQEGLNNILKHSKATEAYLSLTSTENTIRIIIEDNGVGFAVSDIFSPSRMTKCLGLVSMKERFSLIEGKLKINSIRGRGTKIIAWIEME